MSSKKYLPGPESYREFRETGPWKRSCFESRTGTQSRTRSPILRSLLKEVESSFASYGNKRRKVFVVGNRTKKKVKHGSVP